MLTLFIEESGDFCPSDEVKVTPFQTSLNNNLYPIPRTFTILIRSSFANYTFHFNYLWKNKYMIGLQYQDNPNSFFQLPYQEPDRLAEVNQFVNFDFRRSWMLQLMASYRVGKWWNGRVFAFGVLSHDRLDDFHGIGFNRRKLSAVLTSNNTFMLSRKPNFVANLSGRYQSAGIQGIYAIFALNAKAYIRICFTIANSPLLRVGERWSFKPMASMK